MWLSTPAAFKQQHAWDRVFIPALVAVIWLVLLRGFVPAIIRHVTHGEAAYPPVIHVHAVAFVGWLVFLSVQVGLIRTRHYDTHRTLGRFGALLALAMVVLGPWAGIVSEQVHFGTEDGDPPFLAIEFLEMLAFPLQVAAALWLRRDAAAHKRLMLLAVLFLTTAGFGRFLAGPLTQILGQGVMPFMAEFYGPTDVLVLGLGAYDLLTRRRLHPAYVAGASVGVAAQLVSSWLYFDPAWKALTLSIIGR
jgi:hypothetical protein